MVFWVLGPSERLSCSRTRWGSPARELNATSKTAAKVRQAWGIGAMGTGCFYVGGPFFCACPYNKSPTVWGLIKAPDFENSQLLPMGQQWDPFKI